jgi:hypothetical protein
MPRSALKLVRSGLGFDCLCNFCRILLATRDCDEAAGDPNYAGRRRNVRGPAGEATEPHDLPYLKRMQLWSRVRSEVATDRIPDRQQSNLRPLPISEAQEAPAPTIAISSKPSPAPLRHPEGGFDDPAAEAICRKRRAFRFRFSSLHQCSQVELSFSALRRSRKRASSRVLWRLWGNPGRFGISERCGRGGPVLTPNRS